MAIRSHCEPIEPYQHLIELCALAEELVLDMEGLDETEIRNRRFWRRFSKNVSVKVQHARNHMEVYTLSPKQIMKIEEGWQKWCKEAPP